MLKFETIVNLALVTSLVLTPGIAGAQASPPIADNSCSSWNNFSRADRLERAKEQFPGLSEEQALASMGARMCNRGGNVQGETCREAEEKFNQAKGKFSGSCRTAGLDIDAASNESAGSIGCSWSRNRCVCLNKKLEDQNPDMYNKYRCSEANNRDRSQSRDATAAGLIDLNAARKRMQMCPHEEPDDTDRYEKQLEKAQERIKEAKKKMPELMNKGSEAQDKANQAQNDARRKAAEKQKELAKELQQIKEQRDGEEQQAVQEIAGIRQQMDAIDAKVRELEMAKVTAEVKLGETKTQLELQCHAVASQQVAKNQTDKMARIKSGTPSGDFNNLMKSVGVSSREAWENVAKRYYQLCLNSRPTREGKAAAQKQYELTLQTIDQQISSSRQSRQRLQENITQVMTTSGCGQSVVQPNGFSGESKMCKALRSANEKMNMAQQTAAQEQQAIQQEAITAAQQLATKNQALGTEYAAAQQEMNDEQKRIDNLRQYLNLKRELGNGIGGKEATKKMNEDYGTLEAAANQIISCVRRGDRAQINSGTYREAYNFLKSVDQTPSTVIPDEFDRAVETPRPAAPTPATTPPPAQQPEGIRDGGQYERERNW